MEELDEKSKLFKIRIAYQNAAIFVAINHKCLIPDREETSQDTCVINGESSTIVQLHHMHQFLRTESEFQLLQGTAHREDLKILLSQM
jgi:hypothetical protein